MKLDIIPDKDALMDCAWCGNRIDEFTDVLAVGARVLPEIDLREYQGHFVQINLISKKKSLNAMVAAEDSEAKAEQKDLMFMVCSNACRSALKNTLEKEVRESELLAGVSAQN